MISYFLRATFIIFLSIGLQATLTAQFLNNKTKEKKSEDQKENPEYLFTEGMKEYMLDNYLKALDAFEGSLSKDKNNAAAYYMIAQIYVKQNNLYKAIEFAQKSIELSGTNKYYYLVLANIYERKQDFNEAAKTYLMLMKKVPNTTEYNYNLAAVYEQLSKYEDAIKSYDKIEKAFGINEDVSVQKQQLYLKLNKFNNAVLESKKLIEAFPENQRILFDLAELLISKEKFDDAEKLIEESLKKDASNPFTNIILHNISLAKKDPEKAHKHLEIAFNNSSLDLDTKIGILITKIRLMQGDETIKNQCLSLGAILVKVHPNEAKAYAMNADILVISSKNNEALANYLKSNALDNSFNKIWQQILTLELELNMLDSVLKHSESALELFPNQSVFWFYNGLGYQFKKNYKKSTNSFEQGKKLAGNDKSVLNQFNTLLGDSYNGLKEYSKSDECFDEVLKSEENNYLVLNNYSYYLSLRKEKLEQAKKMSEKVIKENPDNATYVDTYAWILYVMKDYVKAREYFEKIVGNSNNGTIIEHYGDVLYQLGEKDSALEQWKKAKVLGEVSDFLDKKILDKKLYE